MIEDLEKEVDQTILKELIYRRNPDWVKLSSPYRPSNYPITLQEVHLSSWLAKSQ